MINECYQYGVPENKNMICGDFKFELYDKKSKLVNEVNFSTPCTTELGYQLDCSKAKELFPFNVIYTSKNDIKYPIIVVGKANGQNHCNVYGIVITSYSIHYTKLYENNMKLIYIYIYSNILIH